MTIKGTLETFNLRELLQMLAFNRKVGSLLLETERGPRTLYVDNGHLAFLTNDPQVSRAFLRRLRRLGTYDADRLDRAAEIHRHSGRFVGDILVEMGLINVGERNAVYEEVVGERLFRAQLTSIHRFEFLDGKALRPDGEEGEPIDHMLSVDALLLDLTRRMDHWSILTEILPTTLEVYEGTGMSVDLSANEEIDGTTADLVVPCIDGLRNVEQIAEASNVDLYSGAQVLAALYSAGAVRAVPTDELLLRASQCMSKGEALIALPLLRRAIVRGDAPSEARLQLAEALEACGENAQAAAELDTFAAQSDGSDVPAVFQALLRALRLRGQDLLAAGKACDYYLRQRPWLREMRAAALSALRDLVRMAMGSGRPLDAATRMAGFLEAGDLPSEDLLELADLYASGGEHMEAAAALYRRADELLLNDRLGPAKDLLRRVLEHDPSRADARRRLLELDGADRRRQQRTRVFFVLVLLAMVVVAAGAAWWIYSRSASREIGAARDRTERSVQTAEAKALALIDAFREKADLAAAASEPDPSLPQAATRLVQEVREIMAAPQPDLALYASELQSYTASGHAETHQIILRGLEHRRQLMVQRAERAVTDLELQAAAALGEAHSLHLSGQFEKSRALLRRARNLAIADSSIRQRADVLLEHVEGYFVRFMRHAARMEAVRAAGDIEEAFRLGRTAVAELLDSDLTRTLRFPVRVTSEPEGAQVLMGGVDTGLRTPCVLDYSPLEKNVTLRLRLPGRSAYETRLPSFASMRRGELEVEQPPSVRGDLPVGVRWTTEPVWTSMWKSLGALVAVDLQGTQASTLDLETGRPTLTGAAATPGAPLRDGGQLPGKFDWRFVGSRTLQVYSGSNTRWDFQSMGRLTRPPAIDQGILVLVDDTGTVYGLDAMRGTERWRRRMDGTATQSPVPTALGVVIATSTGAALRIDLASGKLHPLAPAARGHALALPLGDGVILLGGGAGGCRFIHPDGRIEVRGDAEPDIGGAYWWDERGVAWLQQGRCFSLTIRDPAPAHIQGLGAKLVQLTGAASELYGLDASGGVRAAQREPEGETLWKLQLPSASQSAPQVVGDALFVLREGCIVAIER